MSEWSIVTGVPVRVHVGVSDVSAQTLDVGARGTLQLCLSPDEQLLVFQPDGRGIMGHESVHVPVPAYRARLEVAAWCAVNGVTIEPWQRRDGYLLTRYTTVNGGE